jgi:tetratricopeptide (TPR) repeat protein
MDKYQIQKLYEKAIKLERKNNLKEAEKLYLRILTKNENHLGVINHLAELYQDNKKFNKAISYYEKAAELYREKGNYNLAISLYFHILQLNESGNSLQDIHNIPNKIKKIKKLINFNPSIQELAHQESKQISLEERILSLEAEINILNKKLKRNK